MIHPDLIHKNVIVGPEDSLVPIDWTGAGRGPRAISLGFLLMNAVGQGGWKADAPQVDAVLAGYREHVHLEEAELARMADALPSRALVFDCSMFAMGRASFDEVSGGLAVFSRLATAVASRAREAFKTP